MPATAGQRNVVRTQLDYLKVLLNLYDQDIPGSTNIAGVLASMVFLAGVPQPETLDAARNAVVTALEAAITTWVAAE